MDSSTHWKRNLIVVGVAQFLAMVGFSSYFSFIPFYMQELGAASAERAATLFAISNTCSAIAMAIAAPLWGTAADRYGRKLMLVRATFVGAVLAFAMSLTRSAETIIAIRVIEGLFCSTLTGMTSAALTLTASETPEEHLGMALGLLQTVQYAGQAIGPLLGGWGADNLGYRPVFPIAAGVLALGAIVVVLLARETYVPEAQHSQGDRSAGARPGLREAWSPDTGALLVAAGGISLALSIVSPVISLYIKSLSEDTGYVATLAGAAMSATAITSALGALAIGHLGDRVNRKRLFAAAAVSVCLLNIPQALVTTAGQFLLLRALQGFFLGGMMPTANALLAAATRADRRGAVFGVSSSVAAAGRTLGPLMGAGVAGAMGMSRVFLVTAALYGAVGLLVARFVHNTVGASSPPENGTSGRRS